MVKSQENHERRVLVLQFDSYWIWTYTTIQRWMIVTNSRGRQHLHAWKTGMRRRVSGCSKKIQLRFVGGGGTALSSHAHPLALNMWEMNPVKQSFLFFFFFTRFQIRHDHSWAQYRDIGSKHKKKKEKKCKFKTTQVRQQQHVIAQQNGKSATVTHSLPASGALSTHSSTSKRQRGRGRVQTSASVLHS